MRYDLLNQTVYIKSLYMNYKPRWTTELPKDLNEKQLFSTYIQSRELPQIEMTMAKDGPYAIVRFNFAHNDYKQKFTKEFSGPSDKIYKDAARQASRIGLNLERQFNSEWNKTLMQLLNSPSKNKTILNIAYQNKKESFGLYTIKTPGELLQEKIISSGLKGVQIANAIGINEVTLYRYLKNEIDISRDNAIKLGKVFGCDPADLIFNSLFVPVWGTVDTITDGYEKGYSVYPGEITELETEDLVKCPRETYRPDVKAIKIHNGSYMFDDHTAFYYDNPSHEVEDKICVVGTKLKNFKDNEVRLRYFIGVVEKIKNKKTINLLNIDPFSSNVSGTEEDEDLHGFDDLMQLHEDQRYLIQDIIPEFISPVVSFVDNKVDQTVKSEMIQAYDKYYTLSRKDELAKIDEFRKEKVRAAIKGKIAKTLKDLNNDNKFYENDDPFDFMASEKLKVLINNDERFRNLLTQIGTGKYKTEKQIKSTPLAELENLNKDLTSKENKIAEAAYQEFEDDMLHEEAQNQEPMDMDK